VSNRDTYRTASAAVFGAGAAVGLTAVFLAVFDQPIVGGATVRDRVTTPGAPAPIVRERPLDATIAPIVAPGIFGATIGGRF
jgi:hypothetical protein